MDLSAALSLQLVNAVLDTIGIPLSTPTLRALIGPSALTQLPHCQSPYLYAEWVVRYALRHPTPELFIALVDHCDRAGALTELHALADALQADAGGWATSPTLLLWVPDGWPFIDRAPVRDTLQAMANGRGPAAVAIEGPYGHGKRTIARYVDCLAQSSGEFQAAIVELRPEPEPGVLLSAATQVALKLDRGADVTTTHAEPERQAELFARQLAGIALAAPAPAWFVATVVEHRGLEPGVLRFLDALLRLVQSTPEVAAKLRVVVLCDQLSLLELEHQPPLAARHTLTQVDEGEIRAWLEAAAPGKSAQLYDLATDSVLRDLASAAPPLPRRLQRVSRQCALTHSKLLVEA